MAKVLISVDDALLKRMDRAARRRGLSRSGYLAALAEQDLSEERGPGMNRAVRSALSRLDDLFAATPAGDSAEIVRRTRDER